MRIGFDRLWLVLALALPALVALLVPLPAVDLAYQVRAGDEILRTAALPTVDTWTFTVAGTPWTDQQWLAQVALALGHGLAGWELLAVVRAALVTVAVGFTLAAAMARGASPRAAAILGLLAFGLSAPALALRPQLFGIAIFTAILWLAATRDAHPRRLWLAPLLVVAWANVHGSFVLAPLVLGYAWLDDVLRHRPWRATLAVFVVGAAATLANPHLAGAWSYALEIGANPAISGSATEWQRTTPFTVPGLLFYASVAAALVVAWLGRARLSLADWALLVGMAAIGAWAVRGLAWWPYGAAFVVAAALPAFIGRPATASRPNVVNAVVAIALGVLIVVALPWWRPSDPLAGRAGLLTYAPSGLATALGSTVRPGSRVHVPQPWGSWFEWAVQADDYFVDSRFELFPADVFADDATIAAGGDPAAATLERLAVDAIVVPTGAPPPTGWRSVYSDPDGAIFMPAIP